MLFSSGSFISCYTARVSFCHQQPLSIFLSLFYRVFLTVPLLLTFSPSVYRNGLGYESKRFTVSDIARR